MAIDPNNIDRWESPINFKSHNKSIYFSDFKSVIII